MGSLFYARIYKQLKNDYIVKSKDSERKNALGKFYFLYITNRLSVRKFIPRETRWEQTFVINFARKIRRRHIIFHLTHFLCYLYLVII